jgi:hypothetical protein
MLVRQRRPQPTGGLRYRIGRSHAQRIETFFGGKSFEELAGSGGV